MTSLPKDSNKKLGLLIDLDVCVGCHACSVSCKEWNTLGTAGPLSDIDEHGSSPDGVWFNRVHSFEIVDNEKDSSFYFPKSCLHCENAACVTVCPTGASYKRAEDGIVLIDESKCIGCKLCSWACPYGAREYDQVQGTMKKCTLCVDRIYNENLEEQERVPACVSACPTNARHFGDFNDKDSFVSKKVQERGGSDLMPELDYKPVNKYLHPKTKTTNEEGELLHTASSKENKILQWLDSFLS
tara:strand:- start:1106 stop:1831 length:726 start_codon:yes stop_codon:yes gene_type:complete